MKVKLKTSLSGPDISLASGDIHECDEAEAGRLIEAGYAVPYDEKAAEKAVKTGPAETR
jgi:hypothetical protein